MVGRIGVVIAHFRNSQCYQTGSTPDDKPGGSNPAIKRGQIRGAPGGRRRVKIRAIGHITGPGIAADVQRVRHGVEPQTRHGDVAPQNGGLGHGRPIVLDRDDICTEQPPERINFSRGLVEGHHHG